jgi:hypothetical protein
MTTRIWPLQLRGKPNCWLRGNGKDFDCEFTRKQAITVVDPDDYLCSLYEEFPDEVLATITRPAASKRRPPMTPDELVNALDRAGVSEFPSLVRSHLV